MSAVGAFGRRQNAYAVLTFLGHIPTGRQCRTQERSPDLCCEPVRCRSVPISIGTRRGNMEGCARPRICRRPPANCEPMTESARTSPHVLLVDGWPQKSRAVMLARQPRLLLHLRRSQFPQGATVFLVRILLWGWPSSGTFCVAREKAEPLFKSTNMFSSANREQVATPIC